MAKKIKVKLDYDKKGMSAKLTSNTYALPWMDIKASVESSVTDLVQLDDLTFKLSWGSLLGCIDDLAYIIDKHDLDFDISPSAKKLLEKFNSRSSYEAALSLSKPKIDIPKTLVKNGFSKNRKLTKFQERNLNKIFYLPAAATFSVPGAGKTTEALAYYILNKSSNSRLLIVAPKNAFAAWDEQIFACLQDPPTILRLTGSVDSIKRALKQNPKVCIVNYHKLKGLLDLVSAFLQEGENNFVFLDESHKVKGRKKLGKAALSISHLPSKKLILSGTPLPNSTDDLKPQLEFLYPELKDCSDPISMLKPIYVRTTKSELDLPKVNRVRVKVEMSKSQKALYKLIAKRILREWTPEHRNAIRKLKQNVIRLLQLVSNPSLLVSDNVDSADLLRDILSSNESPKIDYVCKRARELAKKKQKVIIWSMFVENVEMIARRLSDLGAEYIHGQVDAGDEDDILTREGKIKRFHDNDSCMVLVANPAACSEGISLHNVCHHAIYLDRSFNAAQYLQSEDRIHRYGLKKNQQTTVEIVYCAGTIDDVIEQRLQLKFDLMNRALEDKDLIVSYADDLDEDEVEDLNNFFSPDDVDALVHYLKGK